MEYMRKIVYKHRGVCKCGGAFPKRPTTDNYVENGLMNFDEISLRKHVIKLIQSKRQKEHFQTRA